MSTAEQDRATQIRAERGFLAGRLKGGSTNLSYVGISSNAMTFIAMDAADNGELSRHWRRPDSGFNDWPRDEGDFGRCMATYAAAPAHLRPWMWEVLQIYRAHVDDLNREREEERARHSRETAERETKIGHAPGAGAALLDQVSYLIDGDEIDGIDEEATLTALAAAGWTLVPTAGQEGGPVDA